MKKIPPSKKTTFITLLAFLLAIVAIYFCSDTSVEKIGSAEVIAVDVVAQEAVKAAQDQEDRKSIKEVQDAAAETWAKEEFVRHEMTHGLDEDDEEENQVTEDFVHNEMTHNEEKDEEENAEDSDNDDTPLNEDEKLTQEKEDQPSYHDKEAITHTSSQKEQKGTHEDKPPAQDAAPAQDKNVAAAENPKPLHEDKKPEQEATPAQAQKSPFSTKAHILPVVISNEPQIENEPDPYEETVTPDKIETSATPIEEPIKIHQSEATAPTTSSKEETEARAKEEEAASRAKEEEVARDDLRSKTYVRTTSAVSHLMTKFLQKADYSQELSDIDQTNLPPDIKQVLTEMKNFAENNMKTPADSNSKIFPKEGLLDSIAGHFVQIEKVADSRHKDEKYEQICNKLHILEDYFYSQQFLNEMIGN